MRLGVLAVLAIAWSPRAFAEAPFEKASDLGARRQVAIAAELPFTNTGPSLGIEGSAVGTTKGVVGEVMVAPSADYFVVAHFSIGGVLGIGYTAVHGSGAGDGHTTDVIGGARVGYAASLPHGFALWARAGVLYQHVHSDAAGNDTTTDAFQLIVHVPLLWCPAPHFFLGAGPTLTKQASFTSIGVDLTIGGYFGGP